MVGERGNPYEKRTSQRGFN